MEPLPKMRSWNTTATNTAITETATSQRTTVTVFCSAVFSLHLNERESQRLAADSVLAVRPLGIFTSNMRASGSLTGPATYTLRLESNASKRKITTRHTSATAPVANVKGTRSPMRSPSVPAR